MKANFEIIAYKGGKRTVRYIVMTIYNGIAADIYDKYVALGYTDISVKMI